MRREQPLSQCVFEHVYFSRPDSIVFGRPVQESREKLGRLLAREAPADADIVVPVPDSGVAAALGYAAESGLPYRQALIRNHYVGRTFIEPSQAIRDFGVKLKLNPVRSLLEGKSVVLVDDSIVRGTTSRKIVRMVRQAGAREVHMRISCPPTISPCFYGVDTPNKSELIAANNTIEEIRRFVEADSLGYLSLGALRKAVGDDRRTNTATPATPATIRPTWSTSSSWSRAAPERRLLDATWSTRRRQPHYCSSLRGRPRADRRCRSSLSAAARDMMDIRARWSTAWPPATTPSMRSTPASDCWPTCAFRARISTNCSAT